MGLEKTGLKLINAWAKTSERSLLATRPVKVNIEGLKYKPDIIADTFIPTSKKTFSFGPPKAPKPNSIQQIPYKCKGAEVQLTLRSGVESCEFDHNLIKSLPGYTDKNGEILPYLFLDFINVTEKGNGIGTQIMDDIIHIAKQKCGGRLLLIPSYDLKNPSPFYYKCGLRPTTECGIEELNNYFTKGTPFKSGSSQPMYLPI